MLQIVAFEGMFSEHLKKKQSVDFVHMNEVVVTVANVDPTPTLINLLHSFSYKISILLAIFSCDTMLCSHSFFFFASNLRTQFFQEHLSTWLTCTCFLSTNENSVLTLPSLSAPLTDLCLEYVLSRVFQLNVTNPLHWYHGLYSAEVQTSKHFSVCIYYPLNNKKWISPKNLFIEGWTCQTCTVKNIEHIYRLNTEKSRKQ